MRTYALPELIGKTIRGIIVKYSGTGPESQLLITFTDGTCYEWYCWDGEITGSKSLDHRTREWILEKGGAVMFDSAKELEELKDEQPDK